MKDLIKHLKSLEILGLSKFTVDWVERTIWDCEQAEIMGTEEQIARSEIKRDIENILQVINTRLLDAKFFKKLLKEIG